MPTIIVYDQNSIESILAAACVVSMGGYKACELRSFPPLADSYIWIGCAPVTAHGLNNRDILRSKHTVFMDSASKKALVESVIPGVEFLHSGEDKEEQVLSTDRVYGKASLIERVLAYIGEDSGKFVRPILYATEFYKADTKEDLLHEIALNVKEALFCLRSDTEVYMPVKVTGSSEDAYNAYQELVDISKAAIDHRSHRARITGQDGSHHEVFTFFEHEHFWFIRRRFWMTGKIHRNVSVSATGTIVSTNAPYLDAIPSSTPVFVYCASGARSRRAAYALQEMGYTRVRNLGGVAAYSGKMECV